MQRHVFSLKKGFTLRGTVRTTEGELLRGGRVFLQSSDGGPSAEAAEIDSSGSFTATSVREDGAYTIQVHGETAEGKGTWRFPTRRQLDLREGNAASSLDLVVGPGGILLFDVVCEHLPGRPSDQRASEEQAKLGRATRLEIRNAQGDVVAQQGNVGRVDNAVVVPAGEPLTATLRIPGHTEVTEAVQLPVAADARAKITFRID